MKKNAKELYQKIVDAEVGELISTRYKGMNYDSTIESALRQQGYKEGFDYNREFDWNTAQSFIKKLSNNITDYKEPIHDIKVGDIIYNSWGYEQTNIDYYQVVKTTNKTISLIKLNTKILEYGKQFMTGRSEPIKNDFTDDKIIRKTPYLFMNKWSINFDYGAGMLWDGEPMTFTNYA